MNVLDLFSGIGGFSLGLERAGMRTVAFCEIDPFCRRVLAKHWPGVPIFDDIRTVTGRRVAEATAFGVDVICGGFPCQDISTLGRGAGLDAQRSGLWGEIVRIAREVRPRFLIVENVSNLLAGPDDKPGGWFGRVLGDLAEIGFDAEWHCISAADVGASHIRDRVWIVAHAPDAIRRQNGRGVATRQSTLGCEAEGWPLQEGLRVSVHAGPTTSRPHVPYADCFAPIGAAIARQKRPSRSPEPALARVVDDVPYRLVEDEIRALGNAVVPQIPEIIGRAIMNAERIPLASAHRQPIT